MKRLPCTPPSVQTRLAASLTAAILSAGCGGAGETGEPAAVKATLKGYVTAIVDGDGDKACAYFTPAMKQRTFEGIRDIAPQVKTCGEALTAASEKLTTAQKNQILDFGAFTTKISGATATVTVTETGRVTNFVKSGGRWLIASELAG